MAGEPRGSDVPAGGTVANVCNAVEAVPKLLTRGQGSIADAGILKL